MKSLLRKAVRVSLVIVSGPTASNQCLGSDVLFFLLYPGLMLSLQITGGHGGTVLEDRAGPAVGFAANLVVYTLLSALAISIEHRLKGSTGRTDDLLDYRLVRLERNDARLDQESRASGSNETRAAWQYSVDFRPSSRVFTGLMFVGCASMLWVARSEG
jgi:hypothetical protein